MNRLISSMSSIPSCLGPKQTAGLVLLAFCCAIIFHARVYEQFDRVRITALDAEQTPSDGLLVVPLPDSTRLAGTWTAVVLRLANRGPDARIVRITVGTTALDYVILRPGRRSRVDLAVPFPWDAGVNDRIVLRADGSDWALEHVELANVHGFNSGPFSFVVVPDRAVPANTPRKHTTVFVFVFLLMLALPLARHRLRGAGAGNMAALAVGGLALCFLGVTLLLPVVSPYKVLLSVPTYWLCVAIMCGSALAPRALAPRARIPRFRVLWRRVVAPAFRFGSDLALWPAAVARRLAATRRQTVARAVAVLVASIVALSWLVPTLQSTPPTHHGGDMALLEIYTVQASHGDLGVGAYSRWRWNHPGPMYFYALAPLHALTGHEFSLHWTVLVLNLASTIAAVILMGRYGGWPFGLGLVVAMSIYFFRPSPGPFLGFGDLLSSVWNPHAPVLPFALLLVLCARLASGAIAVLPWIVLVASFVAQTHIGLAPCAATVTVAAAFLCAARRWVLSRHPDAMEPEPDGPPAAFSIHAAIWILLLLWFAPLLEQLRAGAGGNLAQIVRFLAADPPVETPTMATSVAALSYAFWTAVESGARFPSGGPFPPPTDFDLPATVWTMLQLLLLATGCIWTAVTRRAFPAALCLIGLVATCAAFWSIARVPGVPHAYLVFWISAISVINTAAVLGVVMDWVNGALSLHRFPWLWVVRPVATGVFSVLLALHGASVLHDNHQRTLDGAGFQQGARERSRVLSAAVEEDLRRRDHARPLIRIQGRWPEAAGVVLQLHKAGIPLAVDDRYLFMFTEAFLATGVEDVEYLFTSTAPDVSENPPYRLVARQGMTFVYTRDLPEARQNASSVAGCQRGRSSDRGHPLECLLVDTVVARTETPSPGSTPDSRRSAQG